MPKKKWTEEEKQAFAEKMKSARLAKKQVEQIVNRPEKITDDILPEPAENELVKQIKELQETQALLKAALLKSGPQVGQSGMMGVFEKYIMDPANYPDPCERLANEAKWSQMGLDFKNNYDLKWEVSPVSYERIDHVRETQPRFTLSIIYRLRDHDTGELNGQGFTASRITYFEDPEAAFVVAKDYGLTVDKDNEKSFLDEMRYLRLRDHVFDAFWPQKPKNEFKNQQVIGNRLVEIYELTSDNPERIPFDTLKKF